MQPGLRTQKNKQSLLLTRIVSPYKKEQIIAQKDFTKVEKGGMMLEKMYSETNAKEKKRGHAQSSTRLNDPQRRPHSTGSRPSRGHISTALFDASDVHGIPRRLSLKPTRCEAGQINGRQTIRCVTSHPKLAVEDARMDHGCVSCAESGVMGENPHRRSCRLLREKTPKAEAVQRR